MPCHRLSWRAICGVRNASGHSRNFRVAFQHTAAQGKKDESNTSSGMSTEGEVSTTDQTKQHEVVAEAKRSDRELCNTSEDRQRKENPSNAAGHGRRKTKGEGDGTANTRLAANTSKPHNERTPKMLASQIASAKQRGSREGAEQTSFNDLSHPQLLKKLRWQQPRDAEEWQAEIGRLVLLRRELQENRAYERQLSQHERNLLRLAFDYEPSVIAPRNPSGDTSLLALAPWELSLTERRLMKQRGDDYYGLALNKTIARFVDFMRPTPLESFAREAATAEVLAFIKDLLSAKGDRSTAVEIHGSQKTGLAVPTSDIDIRIWTLAEDTRKHHEYGIGQRMHKRMLPILNALRRAPQQFSIVTMRNGTHPIINFQHRASGLDFQIIATASARPQEDAVAKYVSEVPNLVALFMIVRTFLDVRGLLSVYNGGMGSYGCFVMLVPPLLRALGKDVSIIGQLRRIFSFYDPRMRVDPSRRGVACFPRYVFAKHDASPKYGNFARYALRRGDRVRAGQWRICQRHRYQPYLLSLQDPANPTNDLGLRTHAIKHIIATILRTREDIKQWYLLMTRSEDPYGEYQPFLEKIVGRPDLLWHDQRQTLRNYGRSVRQRQGLPELLDAADDTRLEIPSDIKQKIYRPLKFPQNRIAASSATQSGHNEDDPHSQEALDPILRKLSPLIGR